MTINKKKTANAAITAAIQILSESFSLFSGELPSSAKVHGKSYWLLAPFYASPCNPERNKIAEEREGQAAFPASSRKRPSQDGFQRSRSTRLLSSVCRLYSCKEGRARRRKMA